MLSSRADRLSSPPSPGMAGAGGFRGDIAIGGGGGGAAPVDAGGGGGGGGGPGMGAAGAAGDCD